MEEHVSTEFPRQTERNYEVPAEARPARPVAVSDAPRPRKTRARIIQIVTIDPRPLQAQLSQAEANLLKSMAAVRQGNDIVARDEATAANDRVITNRDLKLVEAGVIPREQYDNDMAKLRSSEATVRADQS